MADIGNGASYSMLHDAHTRTSQRTRLGKRPASDGSEELSAVQRQRPLEKVKGKLVVRGSWRRQDPQAGTPSSLQPGPRLISVIYPRQWVTERGCSRPRTRTKYTTNFYQDQASRSCEGLLHWGSRPGEMGMRWKRHSITRAVQCNSQCFTETRR
jgi:hypothetical protein